MEYRSESVLRVIQAPEVKDTFEYILNSDDITYLETHGYTILSSHFIGFGLKICIVTVKASV